MGIIVQWKQGHLYLDYPCNHMSAHKLAVKLRERYEKFPVNEGKRIARNWKYKSCKH